jgi:transcription elongation factor GreB
LTLERKNYITPYGLKRLQDEYDFLKMKERPEVTRIVSWAASLGDRSENADYQYGKKRLREIDKRIRFLTKRINESLVVDPLKQASTAGEKIMFGATVEVEDEDGDIRKYSIVGSDEVDTHKGYISWMSPIGKGLLGKELGEEVVIKTPAGAKEFTIQSVQYLEILIEEFEYDDPNKRQLG